MAECPSRAWDRHAGEEPAVVENCVGCGIALSEALQEAGAVACSFACQWSAIGYVAEEARIDREAAEAEAQWFALETGHC